MEKKKIIQKDKNVFAGIAQINPIVGNVEYNAKKIIKYINDAQNSKLDLVVFSELSLIGYPIADILDKYSIIAKDNIIWLKEIAKITTKITAIVGFLEPIPGDNCHFYSSVAVISDGKIQSIIRKSTISHNSEFQDYKYIQPYLAIRYENEKTFTKNGVKYGILIGEDFTNSIENLLKAPLDVVINCTAIPDGSKNTIHDSTLSDISKKYSTPILYANQVGAFDNITFSGQSRVFDKKGNLIAKAETFNEQLLVINFTENHSKIGNLSQKIDSVISDKTEFSLNYEEDLERTYKTIIQGIQDYFMKTGFERAVLGLSGGLDSTVCAVLLADALGKENVLGISMPSKITSDESKNDAKELAQNLGINFLQAPIKEVVDVVKNNLDNIFSQVEDFWHDRYKHSYTMDNIQARSRAVYLWGVSNEFPNCLPIATSDKSEAYMGYATINGDMSGGFAPIADVTKTKLFALARWMNKNRPIKNAIPQSIINKRPGAELAIDPKTGKPLIAEDALMPYEFLDEVIWRIEVKHQNYNDMLNSKFLYEKNNRVSIEQKTQWMDKFYKRMASAQYKASIMPPHIIVDSNLDKKLNHKRLITSASINFKGIINF